VKQTRAEGTDDVNTRSESSDSLNNTRLTDGL